MFDLANSRDFYAMLVHDFDDYMNEQHSARRAFHCIISSYHLYEWVWGDWLKGDYAVQKALGIRDRESFSAWICRVCIWFIFVRDLANGSKHFSAGKQGLETMRVAALPFALDQPNAGLDMGAWDGPIRYVQSAAPIGPHGEGYLLIDLGEVAGEMRYLPASQLIEVVVRFWRDFFRLYRPSADLPVSKHHVD